MTAVAVVVATLCCLCRICAINDGRETAQRREREKGEGNENIHSLSPCCWITAAAAVLESAEKTAVHLETQRSLVPNRNKNCVEPRGETKKSTIKCR